MMVHPKRPISNRLKRGALLGAVCGVLAFLILALFRQNLTLGATVAALAVIIVYFIVARLL